MDKFELGDLRSFCLCELQDKFYYLSCSVLKNENYMPKSVRVNLWKLLKHSITLNSKFDNNEVRQQIDDLYKSTPTSLSINSKQNLLQIILPMHNYLKNYAKENFTNSKIYDNFTDNGYIKSEIKTLLSQAGAHSFVSYIRPITEKIWVESELSFEEFISKLPNELNDPTIYDFRCCPKPEINDE